MEIKRNEYILDPKLLRNCFIMQNRRLRLDYKAIESGLFSATKLIWGILSYISNQMSDSQLEKVILTYWPQVRFRVSKSLGYTNPDWEDVSTEVFIGVLEAIRQKKFREESSIGTYIYSITSHKITDYLRNKYRNQKYTPYPVGHLDPADRLERVERTE